MGVNSHHGECDHTAASVTSAFFFSLGPAT